ncbi:MAG TPA: FAD-dependent oxidoreductase [Candidatus Saccharimonadales bacterium]|nr:FAD-dependent oxidoreductase [Candidatus Saccharimonadales bacterium]
MKLKFVKKQPEAKNIVSFWFKPEKPVHRIAGQYTQLDIPHPDPDQRRTKRWFTVSSSPTENLWSVTTKLDPDRKSTFKTALNRLEAGEIISAQLPMGDFVLPKDASLPIIFVAGGIGITPYRSILKYLSDTNQKRDITLIYAVNEPDEIAFRQLIGQTDINFKEHIGSLSAEKILNHTGDITNHIVYLSGPEKMVEALWKDLLAKGINNLQLRTDFFHNYD